MPAFVVVIVDAAFSVGDVLLVLAASDATNVPSAVRLSAAVPGFAGSAVADSGFALPSHNILKEWPDGAPRCTPQGAAAASFSSSTSPAGAAAVCSAANSCVAVRFPPEARLS